MADAAHAESEAAQRLFGALDHPQLLVGDFGVVRNARRQARRRRLVPGRQAGAARQLADFVLGQIDFVERAAHAELARRLAARTVVAAVVGVVAVDDDGAAVIGDPRQVRVELVLAVVAAVRRVGAVLGPLELAGVDDLVLKTELARRSAIAMLAMALRVAGAVGGDGEGAVAERACAMQAR